MPRHPLYSHHHYQYIEQEHVLLFADELIVQPVSPPTNPGSLTMGFAGVDPRQLAPSMGTTQVGITISAVPSPATHNPRARTRSSPLEGFKIQHHGDGRGQRQWRRNQRPMISTRNPYEGVPLDETQRAAEDSRIFRDP